MNRRQFIAAVASATAAYPADVAVEVVSPRSPYEALLRDIEPGLDAFPGEKKAAEIAAKLRSLPQSRSLPLASDFQGQSPMPVRYRQVAPGVSVAEYSG